MKTINNLHLAIYKKGFTLIELLVAIAIIGILSSFLLANFVGVRQRARDGMRKSDLRQIQSALEIYRSDKAEYPLAVSSCGSSASIVSGATIYMAKIPCDPSTSAVYYYRGTANAAGTGNSAYCLTACLENASDGDRDSVKYGASNPVISGCAQSSCTGESYTLQNP